MLVLGQHRNNTLFTTSILLLFAHNVAFDYHSRFYFIILWAPPFLDVPGLSDDTSRQNSDLVW